MTKCLSFACGRQIAVTFCVAATLLLAACGGANGNASARAALSDSKSPLSESRQSGSSSSDATAGRDSAPGRENATGTAGTRKPTPGADDDTTSGEDTTSNDDTASNTDDSTTEEEPVSKVSGSVTLEWQRPQERENGDYLEGDEIGGYELRYKRPTDSDYEVVILDDGWADEYQLDYLEGDYQFSIAAYDSNGLYSNFVSLSPITN